MMDSLKPSNFSKLFSGSGVKAKSAVATAEVAATPADQAEISGASEAAPAVKAGKSGFATKALAAMGIAAALTCAVGATPAMAQGWGGHHRPPVMQPYGGGGYNHGGNWGRHEHYNRGSNVAGAIVGAIILGEVLNNAQPYYNPPPVYYNPPPQPYRDGYGYLHCPDMYNGGYYLSTRPNVCTTY